MWDNVQETVENRCLDIGSEIIYDLGEEKHGYVIKWKIYAGRQQRMEAGIKYILDHR